MQFSLDQFTSATCTHVTKRTENHGQDLVHAKDLFWKVEGPNTMLDRLHPSIRKTLYKHAGTKPIPGIEDVTPELCCGLLEGPFKIKFEGAGYILTVKYGEVSGEQLELASADIAKMQVEAKDGGTSIVMFRTSHSGLGMDQMGRLDSFDGKQLQILLAPPALQTGTPGKKGKKAEADTKTKPLEFESDPKTPIQALTEAAAKAKREAERAQKFPAAAKKAAAKKKPAVKARAKK